MAGGPVLLSNTRSRCAWVRGLSVCAGRWFLLLFCGGAMCRSLDELRQSILEFAAGFDPRSISVARAGELVGVFARLEASFGSLKALAAARAAEGDEWKVEGYRSPADRLARQVGVSTAGARRALETGRRLSEQPEVARAALAGRLSLDQSALVASGVAANPAKADDLLGAAGELSVPELAERVAQVKADRVDLEARRRQIHARRSLRRWRDTEGAWHARLYGNPEDGIGLWRALDPIRRHLIRRRRGQRANEALEALDFDALMTLAGIAAGDENELSLADVRALGLFPQLEAMPAAAGGPSPPGDLFSAANEPPPGPESGPPAVSPAGKLKLAGAPARVMVRVDLDTLLRGVPIEGELCEIAGVGPVPVSVIEELLAHGNTFVVGVLTKHQQVVGVYHHRRRPNPYQRSALEFLYPTCAVKGCNTTTGLQSDHRKDWAKTHYTVFDLMDQLCAHHHKLKTQQNWALVQGTGKRDFVPPHDPRHPKHQTPKRDAIAQPP